MNKEKELQQAMKQFDIRVERLKTEYLKNMPNVIIEEEYRLIRKAGESIRQLKNPNPSLN